MGHHLFSDSVRRLVFSRTIVYSMVSSFLMQATMATL